MEFLRTLDVRVQQSKKNSSKNGRREQVQECPLKKLLKMRLWALKHVHQTERSSSHNKQFTSGVRGVGRGGHEKIASVRRSISYSAQEVLSSQAE